MVQASLVCSLTSISHVAVLLPSTVVTVILTVPVLLSLAVTKPLLLTTAILVSLLDQVTFLLVALLGVTVAFNCKVLPNDNSALDLFKETPLTEIVLTVISFVAVICVSFSPTLLR